MALNIRAILEDLPPTKKKLLLIMPPVIIIVLIAAFVVLPVLNERSALSAELQRLNSDIKAARGVAGNLPRLQAENARLKERLLALQLQLPLDREVTGLLRQLSELSAASGLQVVLWKPKEKTLHPGKEIYEIPVDIEVRGTYYRLADFFRKMNALERVMNISNLSIKEFTASPRKEPGRLQVSFTAVTYSPVSELEQIEIQKALKKGPENKKQ